MKIPRIKLHNKILLGLVLGVLFGIIFSVNPNKLEILYGGKSEQIENWSELHFYTYDSLLKSFSASKQLAIIKFSKSAIPVYKEKKLTVKITFPDNNISVLENLSEIRKVKTIGMIFKPVGDIFIRLLNMIAVPLVLASLIVGAASLSDLKHIAKIGGKTIGFYALTAAIAISAGLVSANLIEPGEFMPSDTKERLLSTFQEEARTSIDKNISLDIIDFLVNIVPKNPFAAIVNGDFLSIVFFSILLGVFLTQISPAKSKPFINFFEGLSETLILLVEKIMHIAPYAVFALIAATVAEFGFNILQSLILYTVTVIIGLLFITFIEYPFLLIIFTKISVKDFFKAQKQVLAVAFSTSSSAATLPVTMDICKRKLGVPNKIASFVLPLGTTINMDGTALYQAVAALFIAQVYGYDLNLVQQLTIVLTAALAAIGTSPVPGIGLIMLIIVLRSVGIPEEGIALIIGVDRLLDMCRTVPNVIADSLACVVIANSEGELGEIKPG
ncbi:MAG: dicarboxylate/amino acid:cation symporter [Ignavibacteria bacterium]|nr:dicarboxylate/amino acid:cation symporter [Ignavibacteria bacterium]